MTITWRPWWKVGVPRWTTQPFQLQGGDFFPLAGIQKLTIKLQIQGYTHFPHRKLSGLGTWKWLMVSKKNPSFRGWEPEIMMVSKVGILLLWTKGGSVFQLPAGVYLSLINTYAQVTNREASSQARPAWERNPLGKQNTYGPVLNH